ncbi:hypothetical protein Pse7367_3749 (plasmid) [Thalassoporum mexicanum PCC 7367]|uniref:hypothetical protein n=1 Tax=Thalassoporum mexicanum TaxID=3457544 RepID=UPI00029FEDFA|nr:hypothetical protein [Pseudanabaena sp. PCC 7367]AFY71975.1 hypothetical protein Pse7367_3749 [Pseudanabaena sp. PCC 7367]
MSDLHFFGGEKGGVGKSFCARTALQYHLDNQISCAVFDTDRSNPDLMRIYGDAVCRIAIFSEGDRYEDTANDIYNTAAEQRVLVNLPAQVFIPVKEWFEKNELLAIAPETGVNFYLWFVTDGGYDSLKLFRQSLDYFKGGVRHILVKNWGKCEDWEPVDKDKSLRGLMNRYRAKVIDFPKFVGTADRNKIDELSLTFSQAREYEEFGPISRQRVKSFLRKAYESFAKAEVF